MKHPVEQPAVWLSVLASLLQPAVVDVLAHAMMKDGAASDMSGNMQSPVIRTEEQFSTQLASKGSPP